LHIEPHKQRYGVEVTMTTVADLNDAILEAEIVVAGLKLERAQLLMGEKGCTFHLHAGDRDYWREKMEFAINTRSPAQVQRMEAVRGLA
jgi:hypothetical protein